MVRPYDMRPPFEKRNPMIVIHDYVWYIPTGSDLDSFSFPGWPALFGNDHPIHVEYGSGNGDWIVQKALASPHVNWLAVECRFDRVQKIWAKIHNHSLTNVIVAYADASILASHFIPPRSIQHLYINFPDPWPKRRHARHRLISPYFFEHSATLLLPEGAITFVTDDLPYADLFVTLSATYPYFVAPHIRQELPADYGSSFFCTLFQAQGKSIYFHHRIFRPET